MSNPLFDNEFLLKLDKNHAKETYARITALSWQEDPLEYIEGQITTGTVNIDGSSCLQRTCSLTLVARDINITNYYWGLHTKFKLEVGVKNNIDKKYPEIIWFPQGLYILTSFNTSVSTNNYTISIQGKDKMCMLNGDVGGQLTASIDFGVEEYVDLETNTITYTDIPIKKIIREAVHVWGNEPYHNIIINDIDDHGYELLEYRGAEDTPLYMFKGVDTDTYINMTVKGNQVCYLQDQKGNWTERITVAEIPKFDQRIDTEHVYEGTHIKLKPNASTIYTVQKIIYGETAGYRLTDLTYAGDLISNIGDSLTSILDKIKTMLGVFEYFYDVEGRFIFQKKKTYVQNNWNNLVYREDDMYVESAAHTSALSYVFYDSHYFTSISHNPTMNNLKNDFSVWGVRKGITGVDIPVHMRYALDRKPEYYKTFDGTIYVTSKEVYERLKNDLKVQVSTEVYERIKNFQCQYKIHNSLTAPTKMEDGSWTPGWWDIRDWHDYYYALTLEEPRYTMKWYSTNDISGCIPIWDIPGCGPDRYPNYGNTYCWLIIERQNGTFNFQHGAGRPNSSLRTCTLYESYLDENDKVITKKVQPLIQKDFMLPYSGCTDSHTYLEFLYSDVYENNNKVYFYNPNFPGFDKYEDAVNDQIEKEFNELIESGKLKLVDWRELIYQMSLDYFAHNEDDNFLVKIKENNPEYYASGYTGYEQYYTDLQGFWRELYNPEILSSKDQEPQANLYYHIRDYKLQYDLEQSVYEENPSLYYYLKDGFITQCLIDDLFDSSRIYYTYKEGSYAEVDFNNITTVKAITPNIDYYDSYGNRYVTPASGYFTAGRDYYVKDAEDKLVQINIYEFLDKSIEYYYQEKGENYNINSYWNINVTNNPAVLNFWFDFLGEGSELDKYMIPSIGDRVKAVNDNTVTGVYFKEVPDVLFITDEEYTAMAGEAMKTGYTYIRINSSLNSFFNISAQGKSAQDVMEELLYENTYCIETVTINSIPIFYLGPNIRIGIKDERSNINSEYIVSKITLPLTYNGTMSLTATRAADTIY